MTRRLRKQKWKVTSLSNALANGTYKLITTFSVHVAEQFCSAIGQKLSALWWNGPKPISSLICNIFTKYDALSRSEHHSVKETWPGNLIVIICLCFAILKYWLLLQLYMSQVTRNKINILIYKCLLSYSCYVFCIIIEYYDHKQWKIFRFLESRNCYWYKEIVAQRNYFAKYVNAWCICWIKPI